MRGKLIYKYGTMGSAKSANLLMTAFNFTERGKQVELFKPIIDNRDGHNNIASRVGIKHECLQFDKHEYISELVNPKTEIIFIDEVQFMRPEQIDDLMNIVINNNILIFCYGLRTDFMSNLFEGSKRLFEIADKIEEIKSICQCGEKSIINSRYDVNGNIVTAGNQIEIGGNDTYEPLCYKCWKNKIEKIQ